MRITNVERTDKGAVFWFDDDDKEKSGTMYYGKDADDFKIGDEVKATMTTSKSGNQYIKKLEKTKATKEVPVEQNTIIVGEKSDKELLCMLACNANNNAVKANSNNEYHEAFDMMFTKMREAVGI
jgi:hypothetical protein